MPAFSFAPSQTRELGLPIASAFGSPMVTSMYMFSPDREPNAVILDSSASAPSSTASKVCYQPTACACAASSACTRTCTRARTRAATITRPLTAGTCSAARRLWSASTDTTTHVRFHQCGQRLLRRTLSPQRAVIIRRAAVCLCLCPATVCATASVEYERRCVRCDAGKPRPEQTPRQRRQYWRATTEASAGKYRPSLSMCRWSARI